MPQQKTLSPTKQDLQIANLAALAISLSLLDAAIPSPIPGIKPGFANIIVLITAYHHGWRAAVWVSILRVLASALLLGTLFTPGFWLATAGAISSLLSLGLSLRLPAPYFSAVSHSLIAAQAHLLAQLLLVRLIFIPNDNILGLALPMAIAAILSGLVNGLIVNRLLKK